MLNRGNVSTITPGSASGIPGLLVVQAPRLMSCPSCSTRSAPAGSFVHQPLAAALVRSGDTPGRAGKSVGPVSPHARDVLGLPAR